jgi:hypothetical protein
MELRILFSSEDPQKKQKKSMAARIAYVYLKYESGVFGKWIPISQEIAPDILRTANLKANPPIQVVIFRRKFKKL